jgi:hypothetical protein
VFSSSHDIVIIIVGFLIINIALYVVGENDAALALVQTLFPWASIEQF